jgi:DNA polymerase-3 subunit delta
MAILKPQALSSFLRNDLAQAVGVLVYGADRGGVRERAAVIAAAVAGKAENPFALLRIDEADLAADPGRLADEIQSLSLLGGRRAIWVENAGNALAKAIEPFARARTAGNLVIAEAGSLAKSAKLRSLFETAECLWCLACYEDTVRDLHELIDEELASFTVSPDAREALAALLGADRQLSRQELRKLATYCHGQARVELADVEAVCGDVTGFSADELIHAAFGGDLALTSRLFHRLVESGGASSALLSMGIGYSARLMRFSAEMRRGRSAESVVKGARPPVFFKEQAALIRELGLWDEETLLAAGQILSRATIDSRDHAALGDQIAERAFLSLARSAIQQRRAA